MRNCLAKTTLVLCCSLAGWAAAGPAATTDRAKAAHGTATTLAGLVVVEAGYSAAFLTLGAVAAVGAVVCWFALPETRARSAANAYPLRQTAPPASGIAAE